MFGPGVARMFVEGLDGVFYVASRREWAPRILQGSLTTEVKAWL